MRAGVQLMAADGTLINRDHSRHELPAPVDPGGRCELTLPVPAPPEAGASLLKLDLVREGIGWFELPGPQTIAHRFDVV